MHLATGQEPCAVGVCAHLQADDAVFATHRPHHIAIAKGVDLQRMTAEIFGKKTGLSGGRGGHMHLFDSTVRFACSGIVVDPDDEMFFEVTHMIADESCVVTEWTIRCKTDKGRDYENFFMARFEIKDGKIHLIREYLDTLTAKQVMFS